MNSSIENVNNAKSALWTRENIAWIAGLFEGEGCIDMHGSNSRLILNMTDEDVIRKLRRIAGVGAVYGPRKIAKPHHKPIFCWKVTNRLDVYALLAAIYPFMGVRRASTIEAALRLHASKPPISGKIHGTWARYKKGCRCTPCRHARSAMYGNTPRTRFENALPPI
jgi:hypothetical protein